MACHLPLILNYRYRLLPSKRQRRALAGILEGQRQLYNAALEERIGAFRKAGISLSYFDQTRALTAWRQQDPEAAAIPANLQRATLKRLDDAYEAGHADDAVYEERRAILTERLLPLLEDHD